MHIAKSTESVSLTKHAYPISLEVENKELRIGDKCKVKIKIQNKRKKPFRLEFGTSQRFDFILRKGNKTVWKWSNNKLFATIPSVLTIYPNECIEFKAEFTIPIKEAGVYTLTGTITSKEPLSTTIKIRVVR